MADNMRERRADSAMIARIDERTLHIVEWMKEHDKKDDEKGGRLESLEDSRTKGRTIFATLGTLVTALGVDRILAIFKN